MLGELLSRLPSADRWRTWWQEFENGKGTEGLIVRDADKRDMLTQAHAYEQTTGSRKLEELRLSPGAFTFIATQAPVALCERNE